MFFNPSVRLIQPRAVIPRHPWIAIQTAAGEPEYDAKLFRGGARPGLLIRSASARLSCSPRAETSKIVARSVTSRVISASENGALRAPSAFEVSVTVLSVQSAGEIHVLIPSDANCSRVPTLPADQCASDTARERVQVSALPRPQRRGIIRKPGRFFPASSSVGGSVPNQTDVAAMVFSSPSASSNSVSC